MRILTLDLATKTGYAYKGENSFKYGLVNFESGRMESYGVRFLKFEIFLNGFKGRVDRVYFEEVKNHSSTYAGQVYGGWVAVLTKWCEQNNVMYITASVSDIKMRATGKGRATKAEMIATAKAKWPTLDIEDDNVADALWLMDIACNNE